MQPHTYTLDQSNEQAKSDFVARNESGMYSHVAQPERAILGHLIATVRPAQPEDEPSDDTDNLAELQGLAEAAGAVVVGRLEQRRPQAHPATLFGKGKVEELKQLCQELDVDVLVVDCDLSPAQGRNLENELKTRVIDRTELILDIFARRAQTRQAKLQVELAQLRYQLPRLKRMWTHLERTGGGIGTRGPGETQLETDRRLAEERIQLLQKQLDEIRQQKVVESWGRKEFETGALVGYTNVGKSALLNALSAPTGRGVLVANQLFATLGASTRRVELGGGRDVLISDTVGFVRRLPHNLVECFHSTLAEVQNADFLLHVASAPDPERDNKLAAVERVLKELSATDAPMILVFNQVDRISHEERETLRHRHPEAVFTSALTGEGLDVLSERVYGLLDAEAEEVELTMDARDANVGRVLAELARHGRVISQDWTSEPNDGVAPKLNVRAKLAPRWRDYISVHPKAFRTVPTSL